MQGFIEHFSSITDPRVDRTKKHKLIDILFITMAAVICGCDEWEEIELFARQKEVWLRNYVELPYGIPSHDTINRVMSAIDAEAMRQCFVQWMRSIATVSKADVVSIDGKRLCGSGANGDSSSIVHMVSAWSSAKGLVLGCCKTDAKSNEITAIPQLLDLLDLSECIVTIDAMGCQTAIAEHIVGSGAHYILAVKENQEHLYDDIQEAFATEKQAAATDADVTINLGHGRIEKRSCRVITDMDWICSRDAWKDLGAVVELRSERTDKKTGSYQREHRYYISDLRGDGALFNRCIRAHWGIENSQHWILDTGCGIWRRQQPQACRQCGRELCYD